MSTVTQSTTCRLVTQFVRGAEVHGELVLPPAAIGLVILAYPCGNCRSSPSHQHVASVLNDAGLGTLLCDLLTDEEEVLAEITGEFKNDVSLLSERLDAVTDWCLEQPGLRDMPLGYLGVGSGGAASILASVKHPGRVRAIVGRDGRLDRAWAALSDLDAATLIVVGERDAAQRAALEVTFPLIASAEKELLVVPRAGPAFSEPTTMDQFAEHAARWFARHFKPAAVEWTEELC